MNKTLFSCLSHAPQLGPRPKIQVCALTRNRTVDPSLCKIKLKQLDNSGRGQGICLYPFIMSMVVNQNFSKKNLSKISNSIRNYFDFVYMGEMDSLERSMKNLRFRKYVIGIRTSPADGTPTQKCPAGGRRVIQQGTKMVRAQPCARRQLMKALETSMVQTNPQNMTYSGQFFSED